MQFEIQLLGFVFKWHWNLKQAVFISFGRKMFSVTNMRGNTQARRPRD